MAKSVVLIGYSGHSYVVIDVLQKSGKKIIAYCDKESKEKNYYKLSYWGDETQDKTLEKLKEVDYFIALGDNFLRKKIYAFLNINLTFNGTNKHLPINAIHPSSIIAGAVKMDAGNLVAANVSINPFVKIGNGVICNTGSIIEHECLLDDFCHIAPGATLCGNVKVGECSFIGANSVIKQGIRIGKNVVVGAGTVVIDDVPDNKRIAGNPQREI